MTAAVATGRGDIGPRSTPFDPAASLFVAQDAHPHGLGPVDLATLSPFQRGLLVIDGTVTRFIEAYALEPIEVVRLEQDELPLSAADSWLDLPAGSPVIRRRVMLLGGQSGRFFVWADSLIARERIASGLHEALQTAGGGLGSILVDSRMETRRECLWYGREDRRAAPPAVAALWRGDFLSRTYRVLADGRPLMRITERFPLERSPARG